jgi:hypothetical protein
MSQVIRTVMQNAITAVATQSITAAHGPGEGGKRAFQAVLAAGTGGTSSTTIQASNDGVNFIPRGTLSVAAVSTTASAGYVVEEAWCYWRAATTVLTNGTLSVYCGEDKT